MFRETSVVTHTRLEWYHRIQDSLMCFCKVLLVFVTFLTEFFTVLVLVGFYLLFNNELIAHPFNKVTITVLGFT